MNILDRIRAIIKSLPDDGSIELAKEWEQLAIESGEMRELMAHPAFTRIISYQQEMLATRLRALIESDPELRALRGVLARTVGLKAAEEKIEATIKTFTEGEE